MIESWRNLSRFWKTFTVAFPVLVVLFTILYGGAIVVGIMSGLIWSLAIASVARMFDRMREREP